jgi:ABC-type nitrate/sulfonate/bicarbonate transport system permease component
MLAATVGWALWCPRERLRLPLAAAAVMLAGYCATYLCASYNLTWHLATSMQRLLLHLLPAVVFGVFAGRPRAPAATS